MTIIIAETTIKGRYNLVDTLEDGDDHYIRQLSLEEVQDLGISIINLLTSKGY